MIVLRRIPGPDQFRKGFSTVYTCQTANAYGTPNSLWVRRHHRYGIHLRMLRMNRKRLIIIAADAMLRAVAAVDSETSR